ncbi:Stk1 family PASTA domain-containing Ser/Thr kinase [Actinotalea sp. C106]|uniref:Stk1 family PASTA domain-containing Ser/Thr kinase n=1 Tax=Actinotalea sp. C106 TaxID=2908644 RepID=UPI002027805D|nr:Stk1 family PASTA domain-containing Ser/Thr kinase [Actinotalea sp. C106]
MAATLTDPLLGHLVDGRYEVLSKIARGGMATVYLANDRRLDREVALKVMHAHLAEGGAGSEFVARFRREARAAARLTHPGLVGVFDQGVDGETSYLTMEYVDGTNLRRHLGTQGALTVDEAFSIAESVLDALAAAHRAGLVHRDVKPENVLLASDGRVKVADFGLARAVTEVTSTTTGTVLGTVAYLAPELVAHGNSDARTDVYAVGILLFEMLTGQQPFTGATPIQVAYQHVHSDIPASSDVVAWLPMEIDELLGALAAREPEERPAHAAAALDLVRRTRGSLDEATLARRHEVPGAAPLVDEHDDEERDEPDADRDATAVLSTGRPSSPRRRETTEEDDPGRTMALRIGSGLDEGPAPTGSPAPQDARWRRRVLVVLTAVAVAALGGLLAVWYTVYGPGAYTEVPDGLVGVESSVAEQTLTAAGLGATTAEAFDPEVPAGDVVSTDPATGERIADDGSVELTVSLGPDLRDVPEGLAGVPAEEATTLLTDAGFVVPEPTTEHHDEVLEGHVISASAEAGDQLPVDSEVSLRVSDGPAPVTVRSLVGLTRDEAVAFLEEDGLRVAEEQDFSTEYAEGQVMAQSPAPDSQARRTDVVTITVSQGPPLVAIPDVFGMQYAEAQEALEELGLVVEREDFLGGVFGTVRNQDPAADEQVPVGSTVTLRVV